MSFLLDTDICSHYIRGNSKVENRFVQHPGNLCISIITEAELRQWLERRNTPALYAARGRDLFQAVTVINLDAQIILTFGRCAADLLDQGKPIGLPDGLIAATALVHGLRLVTHNTSDFAGVPGLILEDWLLP